MDIALNLNSTQNAMDVLKYCTLYFDKLSIDVPYLIESVEVTGSEDSDGKFPSIIHFTPYCSDAVLAANRFLEKEGLVKPNKLIATKKHEFNTLAKDIVADNLNLLFEEKEFKRKGRSVSFLADTRLISDEASEAIKEILSKEKVEHISQNKFAGQRVPDFYLAMSLYTCLMEQLLAHMSLNDNTICNSMVLNSMIRNSLNKSKKKKNKDYIRNWAILNAMKILLPNISGASLEDILDIRLIAKDELTEMRAYIDSTLIALSNENIFEMNPSDVNRIVEQKINPAIRQFERKLEDINLTSVQSFVKNLQNPLSYAPMITTFFANVPVDITLSASLGLISFETALEYIKNKNNIKNDPLYFTVEMDKYLI